MNITYLPMKFWKIIEKNDVPGFALFAIKCTCFCSPKLRRNEKSSSSPATEAAGNGVEIKHQNGTKKVI